MHSSFSSKLAFEFESHSQRTHVGRCCSSRSNSSRERGRHKAPREMRSERSCRANSRAAPKSSVVIGIGVFPPCKACSSSNKFVSCDTWMIDRPIHISTTQFFRSVKTTDLASDLRPFWKATICNKLEGSISYECWTRCTDAPRRRDSRSSADPELKKCVISATCTPTTTVSCSPGSTDSATSQGPWPTTVKPQNERRNLASVSVIRDDSVGTQRSAGSEIGATILWQ